jgi:hypothetical protein
MVASSVTGVSGPGDSNGKYKPQNNCSCSCCGNNANSESAGNANKVGCYKKYKSCSGLAYKTKGFLKIKTC